ncbi:DUF2690 domain-containing protein [Catenulispora subtropica]|uniref:DUF2690 domain-containing protein n=1 Tax=Catenulispora subtropica TaxID=450798 RepID=A0ABN2R274_9ACTN
MSHEIKMLSRTRRLVPVLCSTTLCLALVAPARAASDPLDPYDAGCVAGAYAVSSAYIAQGFPNKTGDTGFGKLHLMYSPHCRTNWAEFDGYPSGFSFDLFVESNGGSGYQFKAEQWTSAGDEVAWTDMVDGVDKSTGLGRPAGVRVCEWNSNGTYVNYAEMVQQGLPPLASCGD